MNVVNMRKTIHFYVNEFISILLYSLATPLSLGVYHLLDRLLTISLEHSAVAYDEQ